MKIYPFLLPHSLNNSSQSHLWCRTFWRITTQSKHCSDYSRLRAWLPSALMPFISFVPLKIGPYVLFLESWKWNEGLFLLSFLPSLLPSRGSLLLFRSGHCVVFSQTSLRPCLVFQHVRRWLPAAGGGLPGWERIPGQQLRGPQSAQRAALLRVGSVPAVDLRQLGGGETQDHILQLLSPSYWCAAAASDPAAVLLSAPSRAAAASRPGWWCVSVPTASASTTWAARSTTSRRIASSATRSRVRQARTGVRTHGARYAHERHSCLVFGAFLGFYWVILLAMFFFMCYFFSASTYFLKSTREKPLWSYWFTDSVRTDVGAQVSHDFSSPITRKPHPLPARSRRSLPLVVTKTFLSVPVAVERQG